MAAPTLDAVSSATNGTRSTNAATWNHALAEAADALVVIAAADAASGVVATFGTPTFNGVSMGSPLLSVLESSTSRNLLAAWVLLNASLPGAGTYSVSVPTGGTASAIIAMAVSIIGAKQSAPTVFNTGQTTSATSHTLTLAAVKSDCLIVDYVGDSDELHTNHTALNGQTEHVDRVNDVFGSAAGGTLIGATGSVQLGWSAVGDPSRWVHGALAVESDTSVPVLGVISSWGATYPGSL